MKLIQYLLFAILGLSLSANAQNKKVENTLLWEISGKGLQKKSYLFGTNHIVDKGFIDTMKILNTKLQFVDVVIGEVVFNDSVQNASYLTETKSTSLKKRLSEKEYLLVGNFFKNKIPDLNLKDIDTLSFRTLSGIIQIVNYAEFVDIPSDQKLILDQAIQIYALANGKNIIGLETISYQHSIISDKKSSQIADKNELLSNIRNDEKNKLKYKRDFNNYLNQDLEKLEKDLYDQKKNIDPSFFTRNKKWLVKLPDILQNQSAFIAVGVNHLLGEDGLIKGLQKLGYTVNPIATN